LRLDCFAYPQDMSREGDHGKGEKAAFFLVFIPAVIASGLLFGWNYAWLGAAASTALWASVSLVRIVRRGSHADQETTVIEDEPDWVAVGRAQVRIEGSDRRFLADFTAGQAPVMQQMNRTERKVAALLASTGMPPAVVATLPSGATDGETYVIELAAGMI